MSIPAFSAESGRNEFLQLLVTQLQNQDPLEPLGQEEMLSQLAQFSTLEGIERMNSSFGDLLAAHRRSEGLNLAGREVRYQTSSDGPILEGRVDEVRVANGAIQIRVGEHNIAFDQVQAVLAPAL